MNPIPYSPEEYGTWHEVIKSFDQNLRLHHHSPGDLLDLAAHLHERTGGYMKPLSYLVCQAAQEAIETGIETITKEYVASRSVRPIFEHPDHAAGAARSFNGLALPTPE
ncbi:hypothetical protein ACFRCW_42915 [Streptomyces sp. NPDC056653]|uniref:hypothetical protein n=1 Tax=Streptomyces sp. NPDC056653 TaxID=3345894 RepID=UPI0036C366B0